jgi:Fe-S oxidoreductase
MKRLIKKRKKQERSKICSICGERVKLGVHGDISKNFTLRYSFFEKSIDGINDILICPTCSVLVLKEYEDFIKKKYGY